MKRERKPKVESRELKARTHSSICWSRLLTSDFQCWLSPAFIVLTEDCITR
jgi:hypothetical protein